MCMSATSNAAKAAVVGAVLISAVPAFAGDAAAGEKVRPAFRITHDYGP